VSSRPRGAARRARAFAAVAAALLFAALAAPRSASAGVLQFCERDFKLTAAEEDRLFRFGAVVKAELDRSGERVALVARSGLDLDRFAIRYSHGGLSLRDSPNAPWSVRQLYYACDEGRARLFDQGISGFLLGTENPDTGFLSVVFLPPAQAARAEAAGLDNAAALALLAGAYSANSYPFSRRYQNCNQWLVELLAAAWAPDWPGAGARAPAQADAAPEDDASPEDGAATEDDAEVPDDPSDTGPRARAQRWLRAQGYRPAVVDAGALAPLALFIPYVHLDDHPLAELHRGRFVVSLPSSIEGFVHASLPGATRMEFCHAGARVVVHRGWEPIAAGCVPGPGDQVLSLE
jgi:hypothetical protein